MPVFSILISLALMVFFSFSAMADYSSSVDKNGCWDGMVPFTQGTGSCLYKVSTSWPDKTKFRVKWGNRCGHRMYIKFCNERTDKSWDCGASGIGPNKTHSWSTYNATGRHTVTAVGSVKGSSDWTCAGKITDWNNDPSDITLPNTPKTIATNQKRDSWVHFFHRGFGSNGSKDSGNKGNVIKITVDNRYRTKTTPLASTSIVGPPRAICDKSKALSLASGKHFYTYKTKGAKFILSKGECKAIELPSVEFGGIK